MDSGTLHKKMHQIKESNISGLKALTLTGEHHAVTIIPELGGMVHSLRLHNINLLRQDSQDELRQNPWFRGRILFPFNDRIAQGQYLFEGQTQQLPINDPDSGDAIHGFLYNRPMRIVYQQANEIQAQLVLQKHFMMKDFPAGYPFELKIEMQYLLANDSFFISFTVRNDSARNIPWGLGWHPYFHFQERDALHKSSQVKEYPGLCDWTLRLPAEQYAQVNDKLLPTGELADVQRTDYDFLKPTRLGQTDLDMAFLLNDNEIELSTGKYTLRLEQDRDLFPYCQVFIPPDRSAIAIEPVTGPANSFNSPYLGRQILRTGQKKQGYVRLSVQSH